MTAQSDRGPTQRQLRVGEEIRHALAWILERGDFRDPDLAEARVTVTEVRVSPDLRNATVFVTPLGGLGDITALLEALGRASGFLRTQLARRLRTRVTPALSFAADNSFDHAQRIDDALRRADVRRDLAREDDDDGT
ncbi:MAG: 30S ribosome-binding factor RbfA [Acetobacterales bacterium]